MKTSHSLSSMFRTVIMLVLLAVLASCTDQPQAVRCDLDSAMAYQERGNELYFDAEYEAAIENLNCASTLSPDDLLIYHQRALNYIELEQYDNALAEIDEQLARDPRHWQAMVNRGFIAWQQEEFDMGLEALNTALQINPTSGLAYIYRAGIYESTDQPKLAIADYIAYLSVGDTPGYEEFANERLNELGGYDYLTENWSEASRLIEGVFAESGGNFSEEAVPILTQAAEIAPEIPIVYYIRGSYYHNLGEPDLALQDYTQAIILQPTLGDAYMGRGNVYITQGEFELALYDLDIAVDYANLVAQSYYNRAIAHDELGYVEEAISDFEEFLALAPDDEAAEYARQRIDELTDSLD